MIWDLMSGKLTSVSGEKLLFQSLHGAEEVVRNEEGKVEWKKVGEIERMMKKE